MTSITYSSGIKIVDLVYKRGGVPSKKLGVDPNTKVFGQIDAPMDGEEWKEFQDGTIGALKEIGQLPTGKSMLDEIDKSGQVVSVGGTWVERSDLDRGGQLTNSCYSGEFPAQFYRSIATPQPLGAAVRRAAEFVAKHGPASKEIMDAYFRQLKSVVEGYSTVTWKHATAPWEGNWEVTSVDVNSTCESYLKFALEAFLDRGAGAPATVRWHFASTQFVTGMKDKLKSHEDAKGVPTMGGDFVNRPPYFGLAHELVHAWRALTGRCMFLSGDILHDEHVTVGLLPRLVTSDKKATPMATLASAGHLLALLRTNAASNQITENKMRTEANVALRPVY